MGTDWHTSSSASLSCFYLAISHQVDPVPREEARSTSFARCVFKALALWRYIRYREIIPVRRSWLAPPSVGFLTLALVTTILMTVLNFAEKPYSRPRRGYGSPPIAVRTGLRSSACKSFLIVLSGNANLITFLTGISHERLNVAHRWLAWACFIFSTVHTIPFFLRPWWEGGSAMLKSEFYGTKVGADMWSGTPPHAILLTICLLSTPYSRRNHHSPFYSLHVALGVIFLGLCFWHAAQELDSWTYLWATVAVWAASILARTSWFTRPLTPVARRFEAGRTTLKALEGAMTEVNVLVSRHFKWKLASHVFLRFPQISLLSNHPFSIVTFPPCARNDCNDTPTEETGKHLWKGEEDECNTLTFLVRTHAGFTNALTAESAFHRATTCIDGPYCGVSELVTQRYEAVLLVTGGGGITACLPLLLSVAHARDEGKMVTATTKVMLVWVIKDLTHLSWVAKELEEAVASCHGRAVDVQIRLYCTHGDAVLQTPSVAPEQNVLDARSQVLDSGSDESALDSGSQPSQFPKQDQHTERKEKSERRESEHEREFLVKRMQKIETLRHGRPDLDQVLADNITAGEIFVMGCGPEGMRKDLGNACARAQKEVLKGRVREVKLWVKRFALRDETLGIVVEDHGRHELP